MSIKFKNYNTEDAHKRAQEINAVKEGTTASPKIAGVDNSTVNKAYNSTYNESDEVKNATAQSKTALDSYGNVVNKDKIVSDSTWDALGSTYKKPSSVVAADQYLSSQLSKIQSGKTSYSDQVRDMIDTIMNREKFVYDVDNDALFQQALASAMGSGKQAMQDTIGQASALTGGYGSTYATSAANQAYNAFVEDAYNNLPQYYQMALDAYNAEGESLYNQYAMLSDADNTEYQRMLNAYDATFQRRNQLYNEDYTQFRDSKNDAYNSANLQMSEHGQLASDAYNYFNATSDYSDKVYERDYQKWADEVNQAMQYAQMLNTDWWKQYGYDFEAAEAQKDRDWKDASREDEQAWNDSNREDNQAWESTEAQKDRDWKDASREDEQAWSDANREDTQAYDSYWKEFGYAWEDANREDSQAHDTAMTNLDLGYKYSALGEDQRQFNITHGDVNGDGVLSAEEIAAYSASQVKSGSSGSLKSGYVIREDEDGNPIELKEATQTMMKDGLKAYNEGGTEGLKKYLNSVPESYDIVTISDYATQNGEWGKIYDSIEESNLPKEKKTKWIYLIQNTPEKERPALLEKLGIR